MAIEPNPLRIPSLRRCLQGRTGIDRNHASRYPANFPRPKNRDFQNRYILTLDDRRYLGFLPMLAFAATSQASWEAIGASLYAGLENGGPVAIVYGLMLAIVGSLGLALLLGIPIAGAQYHWTYDLAPDS
ncbi:hypothetical protein VTN96DRAFT_5705 [Rasamsonia emersonii]